MKTRNIFNSATHWQIAKLANLLIILLMFAACSKDSGSDNPDPEPKPNPEQPQIQAKKGFVSINGVEKKVLKAEYVKSEDGNGNYALFLKISENTEEYIVIPFAPNSQLGKTIDLTKKNIPWGVMYLKGENTIFSASSSDGPLFNSGTLKIEGSITSSLNILLVDGKVNDVEGKELKFAINYEGIFTEGELEPREIIFDGNAFKVHRAKYSFIYYGDSKYYYLTLYLTDKDLPFLEINLDKENFGKLLDLTKKEEKHDFGFWSVSYKAEEGKHLFYTWGNPYNSETTVFEDGTLKVTQEGDDSFSIELLNGRVKDVNKEEHTLEVRYSGTFIKK